MISFGNEDYTEEKLTVGGGGLEGSAQNHDQTTNRNSMTTTEAVGEHRDEGEGNNGAQGVDG